MKNTLSRKVIVILLLLVVTILWSWKESEGPDKIMYTRPAETRITMCGSFSLDGLDTIYTKATLLPGLGDLHYPVTTKSLQAQEFFEQGLRLIYGFNHWEAIHSFREAIRLDPDFAMAYWGLALAYGPNLNDVNPKDRERIAFEAVQKAKARTTPISQVEKDFIDAIAARYNGKAYDNRDSLNRAYADAMLRLSQKYPDDAEAQTLCADAIMNTMPWDYWNKDGSPKPSIAEAKGILESAMRKFPKHPGAHHLYIHLVEASPTPEIALPSAQFLETAMPGAGHLLHMPSHIYIRTGQYARSIEMNVKAVKVDEEYLSASANQGMYRMGYYPHNIDFISFSSYMEGRSNLAIQNALKLAYKGNIVVATNPVFGQYFGVEPMLAYVRFGKWTDILSLPAPDKNQIYTQLIWRFSRGIAFVRAGNTNQATFELSKLDSLTKMDTLQSVYFSFNPVSSIVKVPLHILRGEILLKQSKLEAGLSALREAVKAEDDLRYMEPPDWKIPARHFLGAALFDAGQFAEAEQVYLIDLKSNRENGWSLIGLQLSQQKLGKKAEVIATAKRFSKAWKNADIVVNASRY
jgi:tetratricopeptide (TPR) repeat protein